MFWFKRSISMQAMSSEKADKIAFSILLFREFGDGKNGRFDNLFSSFDRFLSV